MRRGPKRSVRTRLGQALELRDMSDAELARQTGIPAGSVSRYVVGRDPVSPERAGLIAAALGFTPEELFEREGGLRDDVRTGVA